MFNVRAASIPLELLVLRVNLRSNLQMPGWCPRFDTWCSQVKQIEGTPRVRKHPEKRFRQHVKYFSKMFPVNPKILSVACRMNQRNTIKPPSLLSALVHLYLENRCTLWKGFLYWIQQVPCLWKWMILSFSWMHPKICRWNHDEIKYSIRKTSTSRAIENYCANHRIIRFRL